MARVSDTSGGGAPAYNQPKRAAPPQLAQPRPQYEQPFTEQTFRQPQSWGQVPGFLANLWVQQRVRNAAWWEDQFRNLVAAGRATQTQPYFGQSQANVYNQAVTSYNRMYPKNTVFPNYINLPGATQLPDRALDNSRQNWSAPAPWAPPQVTQYQNNRPVFPAPANNGQPSQFARDSAGAFAMNPYASGQINPYAGVRDANTFFWDPFAGSPGGPRDWPSFDAAAASPAASGDWGGYGGWGYGGGGGYTPPAPEWYDRAARWVWGKEA